MVFFLCYPGNQRKKIIKNCIVSRWAWATFCDHVYSDFNDQTGRTYKLDASKVKSGDTIFFTLFTAEKFFNEVHPYIQNSYIIVQLYQLDSSYIEQHINDPKIIAWFGMCTRPVYSNKFTQIPFGINAERFTFKESKKLREIKKLKKVYVNFSIHENRGSETEFRRSIYTTLNNKTYCTFGNKKPFKNFMKDMAHCAFTASPTGDMDDCFRHWEALAVGSIPIIPLYNHLGNKCLEKLFNDLPVIFIDDYSVIDDEFLNRAYAELSRKKYNFKKLYMSYWIKVIENKINTIRK